MPDFRGMDSESAERLRRVIIKLARRLNQSATSAGLTPTQSSVISAIGGKGAVSNAELLQGEGLNPTMLSRILTQLDAAGLVHREVNANDQRQVSVSLTPRGRQLNRRIKADRAATVVQLVSRLEAQDQVELEAALDVFDRLVEVVSRDEDQAT